MSQSGPNLVPPTFTIKPRIREEDDGNRLVFECELNSHPSPETCWYKDEVLVRDDERTFFDKRETKPDHYVVTLAINDVVEFDAGTYRVYAKNKVGEVTASIRLNFDRKPLH